MLLTRLLRGTAATTLVVAAAVLPGPPASAATCSTGSGVSVVVDFHELGGGVQTACVPGGGGDTASSLFPAGGFPLTYVQRQPGFVCRVSGAPSDSPCVNTPPADAYWALYWSDGESGSWTYATSGVGGLRIPDGGYVALSWQGSTTRAQPGVAPSPHPTASATPTSRPTHRPSSRPTASSGGGTTSTPSGSASTAPSGSASATDGASAHGKKHRHQTSSASPSPSATPTEPTEGASPSATDDAVPASSDPADPDDGGLPGWVGPVVVVLLFGVAAGVAVVRRRRGAS